MIFGPLEAEGTIQANELSVGLDVGSTTVKAVVMDGDSRILAKTYCRHHARQPEVVSEVLGEVMARYPSARLSIYITGSGGRAIAPYLKAHYVQEVNAVMCAAQHLCPGTGSVIELGGQDAKVVIWKKNEHREPSALAFMNDKCAGGTGATLDRIFGKIGITMEEAREVRAEGKTIHPIAAKCGVFAETDIVGLLKAGVNTDEIVVSLCAAIARQNLEVLVKGNILRDPVLLLGGPHTFLNVFPEIWRHYIPQTWQLHGWTPSSDRLHEVIAVPTDSQYFAAVGAVLIGRESREMRKVFSGCDHACEPEHDGWQALQHYISHGRLTRLESSGTVREGLIESAEQLEAFAAQYAIPPFAPPTPRRGSATEGYLGIDGGSTSSKIVLVGTDGELIYKDYILSKGNPIVDVREMLVRLDAWTREQGIDLEVLSSGVTGYASTILRKAFRFEHAVVETVAHMRSAASYYGEVDIICDVGGQDIKVLFMKHGRVTDFRLNTQCSAGNGYFLQTMAEQFAIPIEEYADHAFKARKAPAFNYGCAVFMEQDRVNFQQLGWKKEEIMAGLALVLPLNIWNYVVQDTNIARFGHRVVLQGGTQRNLAAVKAQVDYIHERVPDAQVHVHRYADVCGAIGAALESRTHADGDRPRTFIGLDKAAAVSFSTRNDSSTRCRFCSNHCPRTFVDITVEQGAVVRHISGYGCERGMADNAADMREREREKGTLRQRCPNLVHQAAVEVFNEYEFTPYPGGTRPSRGYRREPAAVQARARMTVGIPRVLNLYYYAPFFSTYFRSLGVHKIVFSDYTSQTMWEEGGKWGAIDPCFPAKVAPAHMYNLLHKHNATHVCFPCITHLDSIVRGTSGNNACPIQMGTPEVVEAALTKDRDLFARFGAEYWKPLVNLERRNEAHDMLHEYFAERLRLSRDENAWAVEQAYAAMDAYLASLREQGARLLNQLVEEDRMGIVVVGHPYHHDPGLNHGIPEEFRSRGFPVLCIESLPVDGPLLTTLFGKGREYTIDDVWVRNFNRNTSVKIWAAKVASRHPNLAVMDLSSFKCGFDAPTYSYMDAIMDASETPHFLFHDIDQNKPRATFDIRIQTIEYFLRLEERKLRKGSSSYGPVPA